MLEWLLLHSTATALLALIVGGMIAVFRPGPGVRHLLWLIVLLKLLTPPFVSWRFDLPSDDEGHGEAMVEERPAEAAPFILAEEQVILTATKAPEPPEARVEPVEVRSVPPIPRPGPFPRAWLYAVVSGVWIFGGLVIAFRQSVRLESWRRLVNCAGPAPPAIAAVVREQAAAWGLRPPAVGVLSGLGSPLVWGLGRPQLLWPAGLEDRLSSKGLRAVIAHELAHIRRRDHWVGWLLLLGGVVWWWHPLFWLVRRRLGCAAESACDALAVESAPDARRAFAEALIEVVERLARPVAPVPALGAAGGRREVERRITMILTGTMTGTAPRRWLLGALLLALASLPAWTFGRTQERGTSEPPVPEGAVAAPPVAPPAVKLTQEQQAKADALERQIRQLQKELQSLRGASIPPLMAVPPPPVGSQYVEMQYYEPVTGFQDGKPVTSYRLRTSYVQRPMSVNEEIQLSRVTYKLKTAAAERLGELLRQDVKGMVMEVKVDGEKLIVTTTPAAQATVAQLVAMMTGENRLPRPAPAPPVAPPALPPTPLEPPVPATKLTPMAVEEARGVIKKVEENSGLVEIEIGRDDGVEVGKKVFVYRGTSGPECLGQIEIVVISEKVAVAKPLRGTKQLRPGDWLLIGRVSH